jgi:uncharacterized protein YgbK (DUF1537 family)
MRRKSEMRLTEQEPWPAGAILFAIGSRDKVTMAQVEHLEGQLPEIAAPDGVFEAEAVVEALAGGAALVHMSGDGADLQAGRRFAATVADVLRRKPPAVLFACGGETADSILEASRIDVLEVVDEPFPGVPRSRARTAAGPIEVVTKSGGFGAPGLLASLLTEFMHDKGPRGIRRTG